MATLSPQPAAFCGYHMGSGQKEMGTSPVQWLSNEGVHTSLPHKPALQTGTQANHGLTETPGSRLHRSVISSSQGMAATYLFFGG